MMFKRNNIFDKYEIENDGKWNILCVVFGHVCIRKRKNTKIGIYCDRCDKSGWYEMDDNKRREIFESSLRDE